MPHRCSDAPAGGRVFDRIAHELRYQLLYPCLIRMDPDGQHMRCDIVMVQLFGDLCTLVLLDTADALRDAGEHGSRVSLRNQDLNPCLVAVTFSPAVSDSSR